MSSRKPVPSRWWQHPYCYYCGKKVVKAKHRPKNSYHDIGTVEHIPPLWIARLSGEKPRIVLACATSGKAAGPKPCSPPASGCCGPGGRCPAGGRCSPR